MESRASPPVSSFLPASIFLMLLGWGGLYAIFQLTTPNGGTRWAFFFAGLLAVTGTMLPFTAFLNRRFSSNPPASSTVVVRQALWVGIYIATLFWLQIGTVLNAPLAVFLAAGVIAIELLLRLRERSQWNP